MVIERAIYGISGMENGSLRIGDRLYLTDQLCTIRYLGPVISGNNHTRVSKSLSDDEYNIIGVEWDTNYNGKYKNGELKGIKYFEPSSKNYLNCSFFKFDENFLEKHVKNNRATFLDCINDLLDEYSLTKELSNLDTRDSTLGNIQVSSLKTAEVLGFNESIRKEKIKRQESLDLSYCKIWRYSIELDANYELDRYACEFFKSVKELNLSYNLISNVEEIQKIIDMFQNLERLILNGLRFVKYFTSLVLPKNLKELRLSNHQNSNVVKLIPPNMQFETLDISQNNIGSQEEDVQKNLEFSCTYLNISLNHFKILPLISEMVQTLDLSFNNITDISPQYLKTYQSLTSLNISSNGIENWDDLYLLLYDIFPNLKKLNCYGNFSNLCEKEDYYGSLLGRLPLQIGILDDTLINEQDRKDFEIYWVNLWKGGEIYKTDKLLNVLLERYNVIERNETQMDTTKTLYERNNGLSNGVLSLNLEPYNIKIKTLETCTVRFLKLQIFEKLGSPVEHFDYYKTMKLKYNIVNDVYEEFKYDFVPLNDYNIEMDSNILVEF